MAGTRLARRWATAAPYGSAARSVGKESPSHSFAVPAPFRQEGLGTGDADCHSQCAHWLRNDRVSMECGAWQAGDREGRPYGGLQGVPCGRADRGVRPYGWGIDGAVCGGTHGSRPTGRFCRAGPACPAGGCATRSAGGVYRMCFKFVKKLSCLFGAVAVQCFRRFLRQNLRCIRVSRSGSRRFKK